MTQAVDIKRNVEISIWDFFKEYASSLSSSTASGYSKAIASAYTFFSWSDSSLTNLSAQSLADWFVSMYMSGHTLKTCSYYLDSLASLFNVAVAKGVVDATPAFREIKVKVKLLIGRGEGRSIDRLSLERLRRLLRIAHTLKGDDAMFADLLAMTLLDPRHGLLKTAMLTKKDVENMAGEMSEIALRNVSTRRKYLFPLNQSSLTPRQLATVVDNGITDLIKRHGVSMLGNAASTIEGYWAYAALECGFLASEVVAILGHTPMAMPVLMLACEASLTQNEKEGIVDDVAEYLAENPMQWYVMHFRHGVRIESIKKRLEIYKGEIVMPDFYYPCEEVAKKVGRKLVYKEKPLIADIAFFRCRETDIYPLFRRIGDLAWCYREEYDGRSRYAVVPESSMMTFMRTIGILTPEMKIYPIGELPIEEDDIVKVVGGSFIGKEGRVETLLTESDEDDTPATVCRLLITADNGIEWRVNLAPHLLQKL